MSSSSSIITDDDGKDPLAARLAMIAKAPVSKDDYKMRIELMKTLQGHIYGGICVKTGTECIIKKAHRYLIIHGLASTGHPVAEDFTKELQIVFELNILIHGCDSG